MYASENHYRGREKVTRPCAQLFAREMADVTRTERVTISHNCDQSSLPSFRSNHKTTDTNKINRR